MLIELNGLRFHLDVFHGQDPRHLRARIVDEAFEFVRLEETVAGADGVIALVEFYSATRTDDDMRERILRVIDHGEKALASNRAA